MKVKLKLYSVYENKESRHQVTRCLFAFYEQMENTRETKLSLDVSPSPTRFVAALGPLWPHCNAAQLKRRFHI